MTTPGAGRDAHGISLYLAVAFCAASSIAYAAGALLQRRLAAQPVTRLARDPRWWFALLLNGGGAALHVAALRFGPLLLVQPLGLLTVVLAVSVAAVEQRRRVTVGEWSGLTLTCLGLVGLLLIVDEGPVGILRPGQLPGLLAVCAAVLIVAAVVGRRPSASTLWAAVAAGISFGVGSALAQTLTVEVTTDGFEALADPVPLGVGVAIAVFAGAGTLFTQSSYRRRFGAAMATSTLANPIAAAIIGITLLGEGLRDGAVGIALGLLCALFAGAGITLLSNDPAEQRQDDVLPAEPTEPARSRSRRARRRPPVTHEPAPSAEPRR